MYCPGVQAEIFFQGGGGYPFLMVIFRSVCYGVKNVGGRRGPSVPPPGCATDTVDKHVLDAKYPQSNMRHSSFFFFNLQQLVLKKTISCQ